MLSDWTRGRPALIIVANCRVKITISRILTFFLPKLPPRLIFVGASRTLTRIIRFFRRNALTSSLDLTSTWPFWIWPLAALRAVYSNSGIRSSPIQGRRHAPYVLPANTTGSLLLLLLGAVGRTHFLIFHGGNPDHAEELLGIVGNPLALFLSHFPAGVELEQGIVHGLHAELLARLHSRVDLVDL